MIRRLVDTSVWIDFVRERSPTGVKRRAAEELGDPSACLAEPVAFELLRHASDREARLLARQFETFPLLPTPPDVWRRAAVLGRTGRQHGLTLGSLDLLIAAVAEHHGAEVVTCDRAFAALASVSTVQVRLLAATG